MNYKWQNAMVLLLALALLLTQTAAKFSDKLEEAAQRRSANIHQLDTVILLSYILVLIVIVVTSWFFKHYHSRYLHESALSLIFGLIIGFVISYFKLGLLQSQTYDVTMKNLTIISEPPDYVRLEVKPEGSTSKVSFHYELIEGFYADTKSQNEQKIEQKAAFSPEVFFNLILPPIIFNAGYSLKKRHFFRNIGSILAFVFIGTTVSALATGFLMLILTKTFGMGFSMQELFFFGSLISATDPVTVISIFTELRVEADLFALVFGESALNDAVAIVLSNIIDGSSEFLASSPSVYAIVISTVKQFLYVFICKFFPITIFLFKMTLSFFNSHSKSEFCRFASAWLFNRLSECPPHKDDLHSRAPFARMFPLRPSLLCLIPAQRGSWIYRNSFCTLLRNNSGTLHNEQFVAGIQNDDQTILPCKFIFEIIFF
ncbi:hypothetical protein WR25_10822 isoform P [Diploscapter pachys]|uniref:Cation/H+ exchanger transmembrane domain-containing protein n=1 Tax=Diploscapter pachys TaxID=2018661 RepID=A0A2A2JAR9_9BILA|nr:hypothetical protein WR25_10822 isoform P [Diploscapter pachys]